MKPFRYYVPYYLLLKRVINNLPNIVDINILIDLLRPRVKIQKLSPNNIVFKLMTSILITSFQKSSKQKALKLEDQ